MKKSIDRDILLSVLHASSSKREARSYLSRFQSPPPTSSQAIGRGWQGPALTKAGNLGTLLGQTTAALQSPVFIQRPLGRTATTTPADARTSLHAALVKIRRPEVLDNVTLQGIGLTLFQLSQLGLPSVVVVDCGAPGDPATWRATHDLKRLLDAQAARVVNGIEAHVGARARKVDGILGVSSVGAPGQDEGVRVVSRNSLVYPLARNIIPVLAPIGHLTCSSEAALLSASTVVIALTKELAGVSFSRDLHGDPEPGTSELLHWRSPVSLDRIILIEPLGGMPSEDNSGGAHVFINLEQEFHMIEGKILDGLAAGEYGKKHLFDARVAAALPSTTAPHSGSSTQAAALLDQKTMLKEQASHDDQSRLSASHVHLDNLRLMQRALALLPPSSSGLVTTPQAAANTEETSNMTGIASGVGTRQQRNALIHNLLTDKPEYSSSLPAGRLGLTVGNQATMKGPGEGLPSTFIKRGMPLTIIPDPREHPWRAPGPTDASLSLHDPRIDLSRLVDLIEDSFNRKLDLQHYLARVSGQIAGIIVAGEYEGGALLTWELPPGASIEPADAAASRHRLVPYLDKFAVRKRSQGAGGVADIVFTAMVRACFPHGVCWRSRQGNPVNKWYFERAKGTWKLPDTPWSMFWTTDHLLDDGGRGGEVFEDYVAVCRTIEPSWADHKDVVD